MANKSWVYENRENVSDLVSNIFDAWITKYFQYQIGGEEYVFRNHAADLIMGVHCFRDLLYCENDLGPEV